MIDARARKAWGQVVWHLAAAMTVWTVFAAGGVAFAGPATDTVTPFAEDFELRNGRLSYDTCDGSGCGQWGRAIGTAHTGSGSAYFPDVAKVSDSTLTQTAAIAIPVNATAATLTFWHRFDFESGGGNYYDGGLLEAWTSGSWLVADDRDPVSSEYNGVVNPGLGNPLGGVEAWVGDSGGWQQVVVDLWPFRGSDLRFRLRAGTDESNIEPFGGWYVDDIEISYSAPLSSCARGWDEVSPVPNHATFTALAAVDGRLYAFGGQRDEPVAAAYRYAADADRWDPIAALPEGRYGAGAVSDGRYIYIIGGATAQAFGSGTIWRYDPRANNYVTLAPFEPPVSLPGAAIADGVIYRTSGRVGTDAASDVAQAYSIADDAWTPVKRYPTQLFGPALLARDGYLFSAGGLTGSLNGDGIGASATYRYDPRSDRWDSGPIADLPAPGGLASGAFYNGAWVLLAGGSPLSWDPTSNVWRSLDQPPRLLHQARVAVAGDSLYVSGETPDVGVVVLRYRETPCRGACHGDCDGDGSVSVSDLVRGVGIALGAQALDACPSLDGNADGDVTVNEIIAAVGDALNGCGGTG